MRENDLENLMLTGNIEGKRRGKLFTSLSEWMAEQGKRLIVKEPKEVMERHLSRLVKTQHMKKTNCITTRGKISQITPFYQKVERSRGMKSFWSLISWRCDFHFNPGRLDRCPIGYLLIVNVSFLKENRYHVFNKSACLIPIVPDIQDHIFSIPDENPCYFNTMRKHIIFLVFFV